MEEKLYDAAWNGKEEEVRKILKENKEIKVNWKDSSGWTALHWACNNGHDKIVTLLLAHPDIDVNQKDDDGYTPFLLACSMEGPAVFNCCSRMPGSRSMSLTMMDTPHSCVLLIMDTLK